MLGDGYIDGQFLLKNKQSLYNALGKELGLSETEINNLSGSVWNDINSIIEDDENKSEIKLGKTDEFPTLILISKEKFKNIVDLVNKNLSKNIKVYDEEAVFEVTEKIDVDLSALKAKELAQKLKEELQSSWVNQGKVKKILSKINPGNITAILNEYPELANDIDGVFAFGFGFDKNEVYEHILRPLLYRAKELGIPVKGNISADTSLNIMNSAISYYKTEIALAETGSTNNEIDYKELKSDFNLTTTFLAELATGNLQLPKVFNNKYNGQSRKSKSVELNDGRFVQAFYDQSGKIEEIRVKSDENIVMVFTEDNAGPANDSNRAGFNPLVSSRDYDFNALKSLVGKLFP